MPLHKPGDFIDNVYRIEKLIGEGGFAEVYKAYSTRLKRHIALKRLKIELLTKPSEKIDNIAQFEAEAHTLIDLPPHSNLPRIFDYFVFNNHHYMVQEFIEGQNLLEKLDKANGPLEFRSVKSWIEQVCDALSHVHSYKIIHRDVKPDNIRISLTTNIAYLVDFGLTKNTVLGATVRGAWGATPGYSPPEQYAVGKNRTDERTDIYALGATLYHLLTNVLPEESINRQTGGTQRPAHRLNPQVPLHVSQAIDKAMAILKDQRFQTILEFRHALQQPLRQQRTPAASNKPASTIIVSGSNVSPPPLSSKPVIEYIVKPISTGTFIFGHGGIARITQPYRIAKYPVTNVQYLEFVRTNGYKRPAGWSYHQGREQIFFPGTEHHPVTHVSWRDAIEFCRFVGARLPTEEEWERAARGQASELYPWGGNNIDPNIMNCANVNSKTGTTSVNHYPKGTRDSHNPDQQIWDMIGNVWEWTATKERENYILKGGAYNSELTINAMSRVGRPENTTAPAIGFRCVAL